MKLILVFELLAVVEASTVGNELQLTPGVYVSDDKLPGGHDLTMRIHPDRTLQIEVVTKFDFITSPKFTTIPQYDNCYRLRPLDRGRGPLAGFSKRLRNVLSNPALTCSFKVCMREDEISLMVDQFKYHLRLKTKIESVRASEKRKIVESDEPPSPKIPRTVEEMESPTGHMPRMIDESILPVGNYSGEYNKRCTVGILLEVVGATPVVKLHLKPFRDERARSTGEMTLIKYPHPRRVGQEGKIVILSGGSDARTSGRTGSAGPVLSFCPVESTLPAPRAWRDGLK
ncbi:hypothetical protein FOZ63_018860 [Perkinsus olseni]|uniref:Uncharacterized protein n=1 Tax=Perkinsus olseni TaxID=32597 RepID=A0A7J6QRK9_PEROL|nr:hypothetical protein FOZ63_018860 [Perkinsus olseni]KAF4711055.1 hypothetical protein FOZ62_020522 [Perkinsus olseni]